ncbi:MAG: hypothetical protein WC071_08530 [Victivallaceae bacterium]
MSVKTLRSKRIIFYAFAIIYSVLIPPISIIAYEIFIKNLYIHSVYFSPLETLSSEMDDIIYSIKKYRDIRGKLPSQLNEIGLNKNTLAKVCQYKYSFINPSPSCIFALFVNEKFYYIIDSEFNKRIIRSEKYPDIETYRFNNKK